MTRARWRRRDGSRFDGLVPRQAAQVDNHIAHGLVAVAGLLFQGLLDGQAELVREVGPGLGERAVLCVEDVVPPIIPPIVAASAR
jgi:hypothetical protein